MKKDVLLSVVDKKGREHSTELTDYNSILNEGHESIECQQIGGNCEVLSHTDYYRDALLPLTMMPSDSDHMSADLPDNAIFLENKPEQEIMDVVAEPAHADQDSEHKPGVLPESTKEPEQEIMDVVAESACADQDSEGEHGVVPDSTKEPEPEPAHADQDSEGEHGVVPDSTKEPEPEPAHADQDSECDNIENEAKQGHSSMSDDNKSDSDATIIYEVPTLPKHKRKRKSKVKRQVLQVKTDSVKKKLQKPSPKHCFLCRICHHKFDKDNSWYKHEK